MATATNGLRRDTVEFDLNVPVEVALKYPQGKIISTRNGERVMYTTCDDRVVFLDLAQGQQINELGVNVREKFCICKRKKGTGPVEWDVWLSPETEKARAAAEMQRRPEPPSELEQKLAQSIALAKMGKLGELGDGTFAIKPKPAATSASSTGDSCIQTVPTRTSPIAPGWAQFLLAQTNALVDVYAAALAYTGSQHGNSVKPEDVRALLTTAYIAQTKNGAPALA